MDAYATPIESYGILIGLSPKLVFHKFWAIATRRFANATNLHLAKPEGEDRKRQEKPNPGLAKPGGEDRNRLSKPITGFRVLGF